MQLDIFGLIREKYKIKKPIRLIELFAGIGSQAKSLKKLGVEFEHYRICEYDKYAIASYNAIHNTNFLPSDITKIGGQDLGIVDTNQYEYILTYSFPCQDLSLAGNRKGMKKGDSTRSGLLWEVERLLEECQELPQILLMENVPEVIGSNNVQDFNLWQKKLESLGYSNYFQLLNAKDYGIPQNRNRCFMISILGEYYYQFPHKKKLKLRLKDMLEEQVDEKFYLSEKTKKGYALAEEGDGVYIDRPHQKRGVVQKGLIQTIKTRGSDVGVVVKDNRNLKEKLCDELIESGILNGGEVVNHSYTNSAKKPNSRLEPEDFIETKDGIMPTITTRPDGIDPTVMENHGTVTAIVENDIGVINPLKDKTKYGWHFEQNVYDEQGITRSIKSSQGSGNIPKVINNLRVRKLTPKECWRLMGFDDEDFDKASKVNSNAQLYKQAGNSIVVNVLESIFKELI